MSSGKGTRNHFSQCLFPALLLYYSLILVVMAPPGASDAPRPSRLSLESCIAELDFKLSCRQVSNKIALLSSAFEHGSGGSLRRFGGGCNF